MSEPMSDGLLAEIRVRATVDVHICEREREVCPRNSCYMPEVGHNARDLLVLLDELAACRAVLTQHEEALRAICQSNDSGPWIAVYRAAGGGYEGLQAIARTALEAR